MHQAEAPSSTISKPIGRPQTYRRWLLLGFSVAITVAALYFVFRGIDQRIFMQLLTMQDRGLLGAAAFFVMLQIVFAGERWRAILIASIQGRPPSRLRIQAVFYASIFVNCLPVGTVGGDVARVWLARSFALPLSRIVLSVLVDRIVTLTALFLLAIVTLPRITHLPALTEWLVGAFVVAVGGIALLLSGTIERLLERWRRHRLIFLALRAAEEMRQLLHGGGLLALCFALISVVCAALAGYCIARGLGIDAGPLAMVAVMSIVTLVSALPISFGGWGVREVSVVTLLGLLGVDRAAALLMSVEFGLLATLMSLPGGLIWLTMREHRDIATQI
jgi:glycosyltransferase 2 family protein